jgi:hypothetical protein
MWISSVAVLFCTECWNYDLGQSVDVSYISGFICSECRGGYRDVSLGIILGGFLANGGWDDLGLSSMACGLMEDVFCRRYQGDEMVV